MFRDYSSNILHILPAEQEGEYPQALTKPGESGGTYETNDMSCSDDTQKLSMLYEQFWRPLYAYIYRLLGNREDAADVTQEVFVRACIAWESLRDRDNLAAWFYQIAANLCIDLLRRRKRISWWPLGRRNRQDRRNVAVRDDEAFSFLPPDSGGIPEIAEREHIQLALANLPEPYALALVLSVFMCIPYQEIGALVGISPMAAATRISRAKKMFIEQYQNLGKDDVKLKEMEL